MGCFHQIPPFRAKEPFRRGGKKIVRARVHGGHQRNKTLQTQQEQHTYKLTEPAQVWATFRVLVLREEVDKTPTHYADTVSNC